jgi:uncharacterized repeat protein (TIGR01451 family)
MRSKYLVTLLVLLALAAASAPTPADAGGIVSDCDEAHLLEALAGGGTVTFSCSGTIILTAEITIAADTTIDGSGQTVTISGNDAVRVFQVNSGVTLNLNELTVANGAVGMYDYGGGVLNSGTLNLNNCIFSGNRAGGILGGGGIHNYNGTSTVTDSTFSANRAETFGGGIANENGTVTVNNSNFFDNYGGYDGGGIANGIANTYGTVTVTNSIFVGNYGSTGGGGIYNPRGTLSVANSTFSGNSAGYGGVGGGGIYNNGILTVSSSTFSGNSAFGGGGIEGYYNGTTILKNTIVANSSMGGNCTGLITDGGGNLSYPDSTCPGINSNPVLGLLQNNGGPTETMALLSGSAAINAGDPAGCTDDQDNPLSTDQRGFPRFGRCDIGAYELQPLGFSTKVADHTVASTGDSVGYTITLTNGGVSPISSVRVTDTLPASFVYVPGSLTATDGTSNYDGGVITWEGQIAAGQEVSVLFAATAGTKPGQIANHAVINGGGETHTRTATVEVWLPMYLPLVLR